MSTQCREIPYHFVRKNKILICLTGFCNTSNIKLSHLNTMERRRFRRGEMTPLKNNRRFFIYVKMKMSISAAMQKFEDVRQQSDDDDVILPTQQQPFVIKNITYR